MKTKIILTLLLIGFTTILFSQETKSTKAINANISFGHAPDCFGNSGVCTFISSQNKSI